MAKQASISLSDIKEDVVVVVFLANHCPVVKDYEDRLIDFTNDYKNKGVKVVGVAVSAMDQDKLPGIKDYMKDHKSNYVYGYDESQAIGKAYGATRTPQFFVLDKARKIRYTGAMDDSQNEGKVSKTYLRDAVDSLLKGETPPGSKKPTPSAVASRTRKGVDPSLFTRTIRKVVPEVIEPPSNQLGGNSFQVKSRYRIEPAQTPMWSSSRRRFRLTRGRNPRRLTFFNADL